MTLRTPLRAVPGVGAVLAEALVQAGYETAEDVAAVSAGELVAVRGIGPASAPRLIAGAKGVVAAARERTTESRTPQPVAAKPDPTPVETAVASGVVPQASGNATTSSKAKKAKKAKKGTKKPSKGKKSKKGKGKESSKSKKDKKSGKGKKSSKSKKDKGKKSSKSKKDKKSGKGKRKKGKKGK